MKGAHKLDIQREVFYEQESDYPYSSRQKERVNVTVTFCAREEDVAGVLAALGAYFAGEQKE